MRNEPQVRIGRLLLAWLVVGAAPAAAQAGGATGDSAGIRTTLRAFYFNLAHRDWEAMAADILSAKVVAHRPAPVAMIAAENRSERTARGDCPPKSEAMVDRADVIQDGDWAEVTVPRCVAGRLVDDRFRLIRFERRWRVVFIDAGP